jgi:hypothetical protein
MIVQFTDSNAGTPVYINPDYVVSFRPNAEAPLQVTDVKLEDGEELHIRAEHTEVAEKLARPA